LHARELLLALRCLLTGLAFPRLTLSVGRLHLLLEFLDLLLHSREEFGITLHAGHSRYGERDHYGRSAYERSNTGSHSPLLSSASGASIGFRQTLDQGFAIVHRDEFEYAAGNVKNRPVIHFQYFSPLSQDGGLAKATPVVLMPTA
jgi:hypothetical protein